MAARAMVTTPSSIGWRSTSSTFLRNSGSSSRNSTPPCARLTSPGRGYEPPPIRPASEIVWCGARNGRRATSDSPSGKTPATEWILVVSSASSRLILGRIVGSRRANIVFPDPGGPTIRMLCPPAAATSSARLACASLHLREVHVVRGAFGKQFRYIDRCATELAFPLEIIGNLRQAACAEDAEP